MMAVRDVPAVPHLTLAVSSRYSVLVAVAVLTWHVAPPVLRPAAVVPSLVVYVRAFAAGIVALDEVDVDVDEPGALGEPYWLSVPLAVTIGASTVSLHVLRVQAPLVLDVTLVGLFVVLDEGFGIHRYGTVEDVTQLPALGRGDETEENSHRTSE